MSKKRLIVLICVGIAILLFGGVIVYSIVFRAYDEPAVSSKEILPVTIQAYENGKRAFTWSTSIGTNNANGDCLKANLRPKNYIISCQLNFSATNSGVGAIKLKRDDPSLLSITYTSAKLKRTYSLPIYGSVTPTDGGRFPLTGQKRLDLKVDIDGKGVLKLWQWNGSEFVNVTGTGLVSI